MSNKNKSKLQQEKEVSNSLAVNQTSNLMAQTQANFIDQFLKNSFSQGGGNKVQNHRQPSSQLVHELEASYYELKHHSHAPPSEESKVGHGPLGNMPKNPKLSNRNIQAFAMKNTQHIYKTGSKNATTSRNKMAVYQSQDAAENLELLHSMKMGESSAKGAKRAIQQPLPHGAKDPQGGRFKTKSHGVTRKAPRHNQNAFGSITIRDIKDIRAQRNNLNVISSNSMNFQNNSSALPTNNVKGSSQRQKFNRIDQSQITDSQPGRFERGLEDSVKIKDEGPLFESRSNFQIQLQQFDTEREHNKMKTQTQKNIQSQLQGQRDSGSYLQDADSLVNQLATPPQIYKTNGARKLVPISSPMNPPINEQILGYHNQIMGNQAPQTFHTGVVSSALQTHKENLKNKSSLQNKCMYQTPSRVEAQGAHPASNSVANSQKQFESMQAQGENADYISMSDTTFGQFSPNTGINRNLLHQLDNQPSFSKISRKIRIGEESENVHARRNAQQQSYMFMTGNGPSLADNTAGLVLPDIVNSCKGQKSRKRQQIDINQVKSEKMVQQQKKQVQTGLSNSALVMNGEVQGIVTPEIPEREISSNESEDVVVEKQSTGRVNSANREYPVDQDIVLFGSKKHTGKPSSRNARLPPGKKRASTYYGESSPAKKESPQKLEEPNSSPQIKKDKPLKSKKHSRSSTSQGHYGQQQRKDQQNNTTYINQGQQNINNQYHDHQHHHYHIDLNIHQVNNILVNYGILPMQSRPHYANQQQNGAQDAKKQHTAKKGRAKSPMKQPQAAHLNVASPVGVGPKTPVKQTAKRPPKHAGLYETNHDKGKKTKNSKSPITSAMKSQRRSSMTNGGHKGAHQKRDSIYDSDFIDFDHEIPRVSNVQDANTLEKDQQIFKFMNKTSNLSPIPQNSPHKKKKSNDQRGKFVLQPTNMKIGANTTNTQFPGLYLNKSKITYADPNNLTTGEMLQTDSTNQLDQNVNANPLESYEEESEVQQKSGDLLELQNIGCQNDDHLELRSDYEENDEVMQMDYMKHTSPPHFTGKVDNLVSPAQPPGMEKNSSFQSYSILKKEKLRHASPRQKNPQMIGSMNSASKTNLQNRKPFKLHSLRVSKQNVNQFNQFGKKGAQEISLNFKSMNKDSVGEKSPDRYTSRDLGGSQSPKKATMHDFKINKQLSGAMISSTQELHSATASGSRKFLQTVPLSGVGSQINNAESTSLQTSPTRIRNPRKNTLKEQEKKLRIYDQQNRKNNMKMSGLRQTESIIQEQDEPSQIHDQFNDSQFYDESAKRASEMRIKQANKPKIKEFELHEIIGLGNFGKVVRAFNKKAQRMCALKSLEKENVAQMKQVDHIISEREVLQYLSEMNNLCPFIMSIYSSFQDEDNLYFELEYIEGCTMLSQIRKNNKELQNNVAFYACEIILTLEFLHRHRIIYRDLKPENIVLSKVNRGHVKLVDFGFAKQMRNNQKTVTNCGTPVYIAPEILRGSGHSYEVDVWSLGVLIVEIVSGQTPFTAETTQKVYEKISLCQPQYNRLISQPLRDLLNRIFVPDPEMRISLTQIKQHRIFQEIDWTVSMQDRFENSVAPFVPQEVLFNERADRSSDTQAPIKPANLLAAIMGKADPAEVLKPQAQKRLSFTEQHFEKFLREADMNKDGQEEPQIRRKRQNPLGDFKFKRINEYF